jgi:hypothetical protein
MQYKAVEVRFMLGSSFMSPPRPKFTKTNIDFFITEQISAAVTDA